MEDSLYYVLFEVTFTGGLSLRYSGGRGCRLPGSVLINIKFKEGGAGRWEKMCPSIEERMLLPLVMGSLSQEGRNLSP